MLFPVFRRLFSTTSILRGTEKSLLATLRKQTGYSFANCKKALEVNSNDLTKAQEWLQQQAQTMGWSKATKLQDRQTKQGLIGLSVENNCAAIVEINCETDFVARNENFRNIVDLFTKACLNHAVDCNGKIYLETEKLRNLPAGDGKTLGDHLALMIGNLGENASLRRALCLKGTDDVKLYGYAHPAQLEDRPVLTGKYGAVVAIKETKPTTIGKNICQHVVGLNPQKIGNVETDKPAENVDDEKCLIFQEFLTNPDFTVQEVLEENGAEIVDFVRFECGESEAVIGTEVNKIENIETCQ